MNLKNFKVSKLVAGVVGFTMALSMVVAPVTASAQTAAELQAQIAGLLATINALQAQLAGMGGGAGATCSFTFTQNLTVGSTGAEVLNLQKFLNTSADTQVAASGVGSKGMETSYFGPATKAAVMKFQAKYAAQVLTPAGLTAPTGYWGALSRAKANALCSVVVPPVVVPPGGTPNNGLEGTDGSISDVNELAQYASEEVGEGQDDVKVLGMEVEASNDGDVQIRSIKISFDPAGNAAGDSDDLTDYISGVTVWQGSTKVASADADDFTQDSNDIYTKTITLTNAIVRADDSENFYVAVDAAGTFDSGDIDSDSWTVDVENIRYEDGSGVVTTDTTTGDIDGMDVPIAFVTFSTAADTELNFSEASDSPDAGIVVVSTSATTDNVVLLRGEIELEGTSDVVLDELPISFSPTSSNFNVIANAVTLKIDGEEYTETVTSIAAAATGTVTFDNLDLTIAAGDTIEFEVIADINDADDFNAGATLTASFTASNREMVDAENEAGDDLATGEKTGTLTGNAQEFRTAGINLTAVSDSAVSNNNDGADTGTFKLTYKVTAVGDDVYVSSLATSTGLTYTVDRAGTTTTANTIVGTLVNTTDTDLTAVGNYLIQEGESETFTLTVTVPNGTGGAASQYRVSLTGVKWDTDDDETPDQNYTSNLDSFKTDYVYLDAA